MKNWRTICVLAIVFVALGGIATWDEWQTKKDEAAEKDKNKITNIQLNDVVKLEYSSRAASSQEADSTQESVDVSVTAVKNEEIWRLSKPVDASADAATIDALISAIVDYSYSKEVATEESRWAEFGVQDPERVVTLTTGGDNPRQFTLYLGGKAPVGYNVYFRTSNGPSVYMGSQHLLVSTNKTLYDFRDKSLVRLDETKLRSLRYQRGGGEPIEIVRAEGKYSIVQPMALEADHAAVRNFVEDLDAIRVAAFHDQPSPDLKEAFASPDYQVTWQGETGESSTLTFVQRDGKLYAAFAPVERVYELSDEFKAKIDKDLTAFRDRRILTPEDLEVATVEIDGTVYANVKGHWYLEADAKKFDAEGNFKGNEAEKPAEQAHIRAFMVDLEFARTDRFITPGDVLAQLEGAPQHRITLRPEDASKEGRVIELFKASEDEDKYLVRVSGASFIYRVAKSNFASMVPASATPGSESESGDDEIDDTGSLLPEGELDAEGLDLTPGSSGFRLSPLIRKTA